MKKENKYLSLIKNFLKWTFFSFVLGISLGIVVGYFNIILSKANDYRKEHEYLIYFLPIAGVFISYMYVHSKRNAFSGENLLKSEVINAAKDIPFYMSFVVFLGSLLTTFFGGSAGKEGTAIALGGTFADYLARKLKLSSEDQKILVIISVGSAFGVIYNVPYAGAMLGMELILKGKFHYEALIPSLLTSVIANETALRIGNKVIKYPNLNLGNLNPILIIKLIILGVLTGIVGIFFNYILDNAPKVYSLFITNPLIKGFVGGIITIILVLILGENYNGLGTSYIKKSFYEPSYFFDFIYKILFTAVALGSVFQGGRGNPTFFVGAAFGSSIANVINIPIESVTALSMVGVFCSVTSLPITSIAIAIEYFGAKEIMSIIIVFTLSYTVAGIYDIINKKEVRVKVLNKVK